MPMNVPVSVVVVVVGLFFSVEERASLVWMILAMLLNCPYF